MSLFVVRCRFLAVIGGSLFVGRSVLWVLVFVVCCMLLGVVVCCLLCVCLLCDCCCWCLWFVDGCVLIRCCCVVCCMSFVVVCCWLMVVFR